MGAGFGLFVRTDHSSDIGTLRGNHSAKRPAYRYAAVFLSYNFCSVPRLGRNDLSVPGMTLDDRLPGALSEAMKNSIYFRLLIA